MVERADINSVLSEIRNMRSQMTQNQRVDGPSRPDQVQKAPGFNEMLTRAVDQVNDLQQNAGDMRTAYERGDPNVDITRVMIASQKASVSFDALTTVRNRVVQAYEDIMNMPV